METLPTASFETVTPLKAAEWLQKNPNNRKIREDVVISYARDMKQGNWLVTHQGIAFNDSGELMDGQHRLSGIVQANVPVTLLVVRGLAAKVKDKQAKTMDAVDRGAARSLPDLLHLQHGFDPRDAKVVVATVTALARICCYALPGATPSVRVRRMTVPVVLSILDVYQETVLVAVQNRAPSWGLRQAVVLASVAFAAAASPKKTGQFYAQLVSGEGLTKQSPVLHLRNWLTSDEVRKTHAHSNEIKSSFGIILTAIMQFIKGTATDRLVKASDGIAYFQSQQVEDVQKVARLFL